MYVKKDVRDEDRICSRREMSVLNFLLNDIRVRQPERCLIGKKTIWFDKGFVLAAARYHFCQGAIACSNINESFN